MIGNISINPTVSNVTPADATLEDVKEHPASAEEKPAAAEEMKEPPKSDEPAEPQFLEVWWPKNTGPFRAKKPVSSPSKAKTKKPGHKPHQKPVKPQQKFIKKPPRVINPEDSPFGALAALKGNLKK